MFEDEIQAVLILCRLKRYDKARERLVNLLWLVAGVTALVVLLLSLVTLALIW